MTDPIISVEAGCQVAVKKKKLREKETQTDIMQGSISMKNSRRKANSRSFDKIMKQKLVDGDSVDQKKGKSAIRISEEE